MKREYHKWYSPNLDRDMEMLVFGHAGARVLVFPTSQGRYFEWEDRGMMDALGEHLERGWIQVFCVDSDDARNWYANHLHPADRARRYVGYDRYLLHEVVPFGAHINSNPFLITTGASFGAYHAANFAFRYPRLVGRTIGMSGYYDISRWSQGYIDENIYYNNPCLYMPNESDSQRLEALRRQDIILAIGHDDALRSNTEYLSGVLWRKGIGNALRIWDGWSHDWPWWRQMIRLYIGGHD